MNPLAPNSLSTVGVSILYYQTDLSVLNQKTASPRLFYVITLKLSLKLSLANDK